MTEKEKYISILQRYLPAEKVDWVYEYLTQRNIYFKITQSRHTKLGDYRWPQRGFPVHRITVNCDLPPALFFWVLLHEAAHYEVHTKYSHAKPHGAEWQAEFRSLIRQHIDVFPADVRPQIDRFLASAAYSPMQANKIEAAMRGDSTEDTPSLTLDMLQVGARFHLLSRPEVHLIALEHRRTRWLCRSLADGRKYLVHGTAEVALD